MSEHKPDAWMPLWIGDYLSDTQRLGLAEHGAYLLLIMDYWRNGAPPDDDAVLARILGLGAKEWKAMRPVLARFFQVSDGHWRHKRIEAELEKWTAKKAKAVERAQQAAEARWAKDQPQGPKPKRQKRDAQSNAPSIAPRNAPSNACSNQQAMLEQCPSPSPFQEEAPKGASSLKAAGASADRPDGSSSPRPEPEPTEPVHIARQAILAELGFAFVTKFYDGCTIEDGVLRPVIDLAGVRLARDAAHILARFGITIGAPQPPSRAIA